MIGLPRNGILRKGIQSSMGPELWRKGLERRKGPPPNRASVLQGPNGSYPEEEARGPTQDGLSGLRGRNVMTENQGIIVRTVASSRAAVLSNLKLWNVEYLVVI